MFSVFTSDNADSVSGHPEKTGMGHSTPPPTSHLVTKLFPNLKQEQERKIQEQQKVRQSGGRIVKLMLLNK